MHRFNTTQSATFKYFGDKPKAILCALIIAGAATLASCSSNNNDTPDADTSDGTDNPPLGSGISGQYAFAATRASDYGSGRIDRISLNDGNVVDGSFPATTSDISVASDGKDVYQIGRYKLDSITRFDPVDTSIVDYQISVNDPDESIVSANPQSIAFIDSTKAYLTRRGSDKLWIIDPDPDATENFKLGEIDLGAYDTDLPDMTDAIIVDDKLFVIVERLLEQPNLDQIPDKKGFLIVIDTRTDQEIETNQSVSDLKGIELLVTNPTALQYNEMTGEIYVVGRGNYYEDPDITGSFYSGGLQAIDPTTYQQTPLIDDGTETDNQGFFYDAEIINSQLGYLLTYTGYTETTLRTFNPTLGTLNDTLFEGLQDTDITLLEKGPDNHLWVGINDSTPGFVRIDLGTGLMATERVRTELIPTALTFIDIAPQQ